MPPLPAKSGRQTEKHIKKQERYYTRFLNAIGRSEELKSSVFFIEFLNQTDEKVYKKDQKNYEKLKFGKSIADLATVKGEVNV